MVTPCHRCIGSGRGVGPACHQLTAAQGPEYWASLQAALGDWLMTLPKPVGVMACDDGRARHVLEACRTRGLRVPHDVAVIGVDDDELICELAVPPLTSIRQAARRIGYEAARLLDVRMRSRGGSGSPPPAGHRRRPAGAGPRPALSRHAARSHRPAPHPAVDARRRLHGPRGHAVSHRPHVHAAQSGFFVSQAREIKPLNPRENSLHGG
jgi:hypothetical protein